MEDTDCAPLTVTGHAKHARAHDVLIFSHILAINKAMASRMCQLAQVSE